MTKLHFLENGALFFISATLAVAVIWKAISLAYTHEMLDRPGQHKRHKHSVPFVGGTGVYAAFLVALVFLANTCPEQSMKWLGLGIGATAIFITGFIDDVVKLSFRIRFVIQACAALVIILVSEVILIDLGYLLPGITFNLTLIPAVLVTLFAVVGGINALNMVDGIDGLSGTLSLITLVLLGTVAYIAGNEADVILSTALAGGILGFLLFNLRHPLQPQARVFLGDNGSMLTGFLIVWLLIDLSQGSKPAMTPVTALWLFSIPLMDTFGVMLRRSMQGKSLFEPGHDHLHHKLLHAGYRVNNVVFAICSLHLLFGLTGFAALYLGISEFVMLIIFLLLFVIYVYLSLNPWYLICALRGLHYFRGLVPPESIRIFLGSYSRNEAGKLIYRISRELHPEQDLLICTLKLPSFNGRRKCYAVVAYLKPLETNIDTTKKEIEYYEKIGDCVDRLNNEQEIHYFVEPRPFKVRKQEVHYFVEPRPFRVRNPQNDRRTRDHGNPRGNRRRIDRRNPDRNHKKFNTYYNHKID